MSAMTPVTSMKIVTVLGTRPEIIKLSSILPLLDSKTKHILIHTGQHYDYEMDAVFFKELELSLPHYQLDVGSMAAGKQTARMLEKIEDILIKEKPNIVVVQGDTNSTLAGALAAVKLGITVAHVEAGCRSFNFSQPEEINRKIVDHIAHLLFAPDEVALRNLKSESIDSEKLFLVGNTSADVFTRNRKFADTSTIISELGFLSAAYAVVTVHRAENTDIKENLHNIVSAINEISRRITVVFPLHPRTAASLEKHGFKLDSSVKIIKPLSYLPFLKLLSHARFCVSDSGGVQEEAALLNVPCIIPRDETEWIRYVELGKNMLTGAATSPIVHAAEKLLNDRELERIKSIRISHTYGASEKIVEILLKHGI